MALLEARCFSECVVHSLRVGKHGGHVWWAEKRVHKIDVDMDFGWRMWEIHYVRRGMVGPESCLVDRGSTIVEEPSSSLRFCCGSMWFRVRNT